MGKGRLKPEGSIGFAAIFSFSSSASCSLFALALRFWNQILTWVSVRFRELENSARSAMERYCFWRNLRSRARSWDVVKGVRGLRLVLCFRRVQVVGLMCLGGGEYLPGSCIHAAPSSEFSDLTEAVSKGLTSGPGL